MIPDPRVRERTSSHVAILIRVAGLAAQSTCDADCGRSADGEPSSGRCHHRHHDNVARCHTGQRCTAERHAAEEFRDLVAQATGTRMDIITMSQARTSGIFLGKATGLKADDLDEEGFRIRIADQRIEISGSSPRGTLYGVYTFLEDELGVRFLTADHTHVPNASPSQVLKTGERVFRPRFAWRNSYYGANMAHPELAARLRNNAVTERSELGGRSSWSLISPQRQRVRTCREIWQGPSRVFQPGERQAARLHARRSIRAGRDPALLHQSRCQGADHRAVSSSGWLGMDRPAATSRSLKMTTRCTVAATSAAPSMSTRNRTWGLC